MEIFLIVLVVLVFVFAFQSAVTMEEKKKLEIELATIKEKFDAISEEEYQKLKKRYDEMVQNIKDLQSEVDLIESGIYETISEDIPSEDIKHKLETNKYEQKELIKNKTAAICRTNWRIDGSEAKGRQSTNKNIKITLRAFNGECDSLIAKVKWNNLAQSINRIERSFEIINKLNDKNTISITNEYLELRLEELKLTHQLKVQLQKEKEDQQRIKAQMREEAKARAEIEKAQRDAEKEEEKYQAALKKAKAELGNAHGAKVDKLKDKIQKLEQALAEAHEKKERAISRAQMTKSGHVYVISNIGSFGENVFKIGMTRRLIPMDRVKELGDASVPFPFDVHAMIFSEDAPALESQLHKKFHNNRVNKVNERKEFFNVSIDEIQKIVTSNHNSKIHFTLLADAQEFRETEMINKKNN